jgi:hypothetical protein
MELLEDMIAQPSFSDQKTVKIKESIEAKHLPPGWNSFLNDIMRSLPSEHTTKLADSSDLPPDNRDIFLAGFEAAVLGENAQHPSGNILIRDARHLSKNEQIRSCLETLLKTKNVPTLKNSLYLLKESLRPR